MLREAGGTLCAVYGLILLGLLIAQRDGRGAYDAYVAFLETPGMLAIQAVLLAFIVIHAITWIYLIGKSQGAMSSYRAPPWTRIVGLLGLVLIAASGAVLFVVFGGL